MPWMCIRLRVLKEHLVWGWEISKVCSGDLGWGVLTGRLLRCGRILMWSNYTVFKGVVQPFCARVYHANVFTDAHCLWDWDDCGVVSGCVNWVL